MVPGAFWVSSWALGDLVAWLAPKLKRRIRGGA
jgi:hypothetical protein